MNLFGLNINITRRSGAPPAELPLSQASLAWLRGEATDGPAPTLTNAYQQVVWVYRAINVLAEQIANVPFIFATQGRGRKTLVTSGPLTEFYAHPHPQIDRFQYWELRIIWLMLRGECMRVPIFEDQATGAHSAIRTPHSTLKSVLILDPAQFQHIIENHQLIGWRYLGSPLQTPLESQVLLPEEAWFEKLPNPFDFWRGMPPLLVASGATKTDFAAASFMRGLLENNADLGVIVRTQGQLDPTQREQLRAALRDRKRRAGTADSPLLLWSGAEIVKPQLSSADLQFLENRKFCRAEICSAFGVPEEIVTITDNAKYDVMAGSRQNFIENRVAPLCSRLEAAEEATVKAIDPTATGWFDIDSLPIMQTARRTRLATARTGFDMGIPFNELNRVLDLGFKPLPWGDKGFIPTAMQPAGSAGLPPASVSSPAPATNSSYPSHRS